MKYNINISIITVEGSECFAEHINARHSDAHGEGDN